jgi:two-component system, cell cycle response regulator
MGTAGDKTHITKTMELQTADMSVPERCVCLVVARGNDLGRRFALQSPRTTIGRAPEANITLNDESISRVHCCIVQNGDGFILEDLGSRNGTFANALRVGQTAILPGTPIQIGHTMFHLELKDAAQFAYEDELFQNATLDPLTGVPNRRQFVSRACEELTLARRGKLPVVVVMLDVDRFKAINDSLGHPAGDRVLQQVARILLTHKRREDLVGRFGGDEFIVMLRGNLHLDGVLSFCEKIRAAVHSHAFEPEGTNLQVTVSIGACFSVYPESHSLDDLIALADQALYRAKGAGRNRVECEFLGSDER